MPDYWYIYGTQQMEDVFKFGVHKFRDSVYLHTPFRLK
jgi:hypothetical protein